ncbi:hypothetical protein ABT392_13720 [Paucibacter sp. JuS9]|uniref:hypothetical protein n=1 Tax=Roseateles TaxID=93681 RepID=UPI002FE60688
MRRTLCSRSWRSMNACFIFATGVLFDINKNYQLAFGLICVLLALSLAASTRVKRY